MVAVCTTVVTLVAVKLAILPVPDAARPIVLFVLVQLNTVPATVPVNTTGAVGEALHNTWLAGCATVGVGLTVIVNVMDAPVQVTPPLVYTGVTMIVATEGVTPELIAVKLGILFVPLSARPIVALSLTQVNCKAPVGPVVGLVKFTGAVGAPLHTIWFATGFTIGVGFTVIVKLTGKLTQLIPPLL